MTRREIADCLESGAQAWDTLAYQTRSRSQQRRYDEQAKRCRDAANYVRTAAPGSLSTPGGPDAPR